MKKKLILSLIFLIINFFPVYAEEKIPDYQSKILKGARERLKDAYDSSYYSAGYPPKGKSACVDILYFGWKAAGWDMKEEVNKYFADNPDKFTDAQRDPAIDHRRVRNLLIYFKNRPDIRKLTVKTDNGSLKEWLPGDFVFWSMANDGVADHCGVISDKRMSDGTPLVIHQFPPVCKEENVLRKWKIMLHTRREN